MKHCPSCGSSEVYCIGIVMSDEGCYRQYYCKTCGRTTSIKEEPNVN